MNKKLRDEARRLRETIEKIKNERLSFDPERLIAAMKPIEEFERKLIALIEGDYNIKVGVELVGDDLIEKIEGQTKEGSK